MSDADWLSDLKLRASYGVQGNVDKDTSPLVVGEWDNTQVLPDNSESNIIVSSPPNQYLRWEKTTRPFLRSVEFHCLQPMFTDG